MEDFKIYIHEGYWFAVLFLVWFLFDFCIRVILSGYQVIIRVNWTRKHSFYFYSLKEIVYNWHYFLLEYLVGFTGEPICAWCFCFERSLVIDPISQIKSGLFILSISSCVSFGKLCLSGNRSISYMLSYLWI